MDDRIARVHAREVFDSRGQPTVEVDVLTADGSLGRAIVPSGASTGKHEARELRDGDPQRLGGKGTRRAAANVRDALAPIVLGLAASEQRAVDQALRDCDGTPDKSRLGANALLGVSLACAHAAAAARKVPLWQWLAHLHGSTPAMPTPMVNLISGGLHAGRNLEFQDFLFLPLSARSYSEALEMTLHAYRSLSITLTRHGFEGVLVGDEGGFGPKLRNNEQAIELILEAYQHAGLKPGVDAAIALDVASTHFHKDDTYQLEQRSLDAPKFTQLLAQWVEKYPIVSIEDGMAEDDWAGWRTLTQALGQRVQLIGDDLFVTNPARLARGIEAGVANAILIKVNQIGTLTETLDTIQQARAAGYRAIVSARSGETEDSTIADLAVATGVGQIKIGSVARSERLAKYNQLLRIEEQLGGSNAPFARWSFGAFSGT